MSGDIDVNETLREQCSVGGDEDVLRQLRDGAAVNSQNRVNGWTALHFAVRREHASIVRLLLEHGADASAKNLKGEKAIDMTSNKEIRKIITDFFSKNNNCKREDQNNEPKSSLVGVNEPSVNIVPGYLANPVFPYTLATSTSLKGESDNQAGSDHNDKHVLVPGYLANPVIPYAVAASGQIMASGQIPTTEVLQGDGGVNFVPGYIANPVIPCAVAASHPNENTNEIKQIFVPHVEQFGSLVNSYVNSVKSLEKSSEYHLCDSCKTTPVATVFVGTDISELVIKIRNANHKDPDFIEVELNRKILTYDELLNVCTRELKIDRDSIAKIRKLPDTIVRRDKDVQRLQPYQELEVVLLS